MLAMVASCGGCFGLVASSCGDSDVSLTIECMGSDPVVVNGVTYVRGYDSYAVGSAGVVWSSVVCCDESFGLAAPTP